MRRYVLAAAAVLPLAGCASVPTHSPAHLVQTIDPAQRDADRVQARVQPGADASQTAIVSGYLLAMPTAQRDASSARLFMTARAARAWHVGEQVVVGSVPQVGVVDKTNQVPVTFVRYGTVGSDGSYQPEPKPQQTTWKFKLVKNADGQWRIDKPPPGGGVLVSPAFFHSSYQRRTVYFLDPSMGRVVPDVRYLPNDPEHPEHLVTRMVGMLTQGPSDWLLPVVTSALNTVTVNRVETDPVQHVVRIDVAGLNGQVNENREGAVAQLVWTLGSLSASVFGVKVTTDGQPVDLPELDTTPLTPADMLSFDPDALPDTSTSGPDAPDPEPSDRTSGPSRPRDPRTAVQPYYVRDGGVFALGGKAVVDGRYDLSAVGVSTDLARVAGVGPAPDGRGQTLWLGKIGDGRLLASKLRASTLTRPTWDRATSSFWTVANGRFVERVSLDGRVHHISLGAGVLGPRASIGVLRLAREGTRVAYTSGEPGNRRLYVARVHSGADSIVLEKPIPIVSVLVDVRDAAWEQSTELVVLGAGEDGELVALRAYSDGSSTDPAHLPRLDPSGATSITAAPDKPEVVGVADGTLSTNQTTWGNPDKKDPVRGAAPAYPG